MKLFNKKNIPKILIIVILITILILLKNKTKNLKPIVNDINLNIQSMAKKLEEFKHDRINLINGYKNTRIHDESVNNSNLSNSIANSIGVIQTNAYA